MEPILLRLDTIINNYASIDLMQGYNYTLEAYITDNYKDMDLTGVTVQLQMQKPDKKFIIQTENIVIEGNKINATLDKDFTREDGQAKLQVVLLKDNFTFGSWVVKAKIKPSAINDNDGQSENKITITEALINKINEAENTKIELDKSIANGDVATIKKNVDKIKDVEIPKINEQLDNIVQQIYNLEVSIELFIKEYEINYTKAFERAFDFLESKGGGTILVPAKTYEAIVRIPSNCGLKGVGRSSIIKTPDNANIYCIGLKDGQTRNITINNISVDGNKNKQDDYNSHGIFINGDGLLNGNAGINTNDARHYLSDIFIRDCKGRGFYLKGRGENIISNISVLTCEQEGFVVESFDNFYNTISAGANYKSAIVISDSNSRFVNIKGWNSGESVIDIDLNNSYGIFIKNAYNISITASESQGNYSNGVYIKDSRSIDITGCCSDRNSMYNKNNTINDKIACAFIFDNVTDSKIYGNVKGELQLYASGYYNYPVRNDIKIYGEDCIETRLVESSGQNNLDICIYNKTMSRTIQIKESIIDRLNVGGQTSKNLTNAYLYSDRQNTIIPLYVKRNLNGNTSRDELIRFEIEDDGVVDTLKINYIYSENLTEIVSPGALSLSGTWDKPLKLNGHSLWINNGKLMIKFGNPNNATDGNLIGSQS